MKKKMAWLAAAALIPSLALTGCSRADQAASGDAGKGVPVGASKEEYQKAFADMDPIELTYQTSAASANATSGQRDAEWAKQVEDWSGGKVKIKVVYGNAIVPPDEIASALQDGRLDMAHWLTAYHSDEMPAFTELQSALVNTSVSPLEGEIVQHLAAQEVAFNTPAIMKEFDQHGMFVLNPLMTSGATHLACADAKNGPSDFHGDQIRANADAQKDQIRALGASTVTLQLSETYEGLQRGVIQCTFGSATSIVNSGWTESAPYSYTPETTSFGVGAGSIVAGSKWDRLPLAVRQLIFDRMVDYNAGELGQAFVSNIELAQESKKNGGSSGTLSAALDKKVQEGSEQVLESVRSSKALDGKKLISDLEASEKKWKGIAEELGYKDKGGYGDFPSWYQGDGKVVDPEYLNPIAERFYKEVLEQHRPQ